MCVFRHMQASVPVFMFVSVCVCVVTPERSQAVMVQLSLFAQPPRDPAGPQIQSEDVVSLLILHKQFWLRYG